MSNITISEFRIPITAETFKTWHVCVGTLVPDTLAIGKRTDSDVSALLENNCMNLGISIHASMRSQAADY
jgi:hypothetical protein